MPALKPSTPSQLATAKLAESGLDLSDAKALGIEVLGPEATAKAGFEVMASLKLNYFGPDGKPLDGGPKRPPFFRIRYLHDPNTTSFAKLTGDELRYMQPPQTLCRAYFPKTIDWEPLLKNPDHPLLITEGELKAACACKHGFNTIGLGGVESWKALSQGIEFLPELEAINWVTRFVYICFDSDYKENPMVCSALARLAEAIERRGGHPHLVMLAAVKKDSKTGLDDYLVDQGAEPLKEILHIAVPLGLSRVLFDFNERFVFIRSPALVVNQKTSVRITPESFTKAVEAGKRHHTRVLGPKGELLFKAVNASGAWVSWPLRHEAEKLTYAPGKERFILPDCHWNTWPGWGVQPIKGDVKPFLKLVDHLFSNAEPEAKKWFLQWCAYPFQYPGTKLFSAVVFHGVNQGTGKSLVGYTLGRIYGKNFAEISKADLHGSFNEWAVDKQFIMGDDVTGSDKRDDADMLKKLITQKEIRINAKFIPTYTLPDCVNHFYTSNHPDAFFLDDKDRRFMVHDVDVEPLELAFYRFYAGNGIDTGWLYGDGGRGASIVFDYLMHLDLRGFDPSAPAIKTAAKERMIAGVRSDLGDWVRRLLASPDSMLKVGEVRLKKDLFTTKELLSLYDDLGRTGTTANGLGREMSRAGFRQVCDGAPVRFKDGSQSRLYVVRNPMKWLKASQLECVEHFERYDMAVTRAAKF